MKKLSNYNSITKLLFLATAVLIFTSGCGGRNAQMEALKRKANANKRAAQAKLDEEDSTTETTVASEQTKDKKSATNNETDSGETANDNMVGKGSTAEDVVSRPTKLPNMNRAEQQNAKSAYNSTSDFVAFRKKIVAKLNQRRATLTHFQKLNAVGSALAEYVQEHKEYPPVTIGSKQNLSWRVALLPYLGYPELYEKFDVESRFNSPLNNRLIDLMPPEYETLADAKGKTTLVAPVGTYTAFWSDKPTSLLRLEDGISDTIGILDADESQAVVWSRPADLQLGKGKEIFNGLGGKFDGQFIVIFGDGRLEKVSRTIGPRSFTAMLSYDRGDRYSAKLLSPLEESDFVAKDNSETQGLTTLAPEKTPSETTNTSPASFTDSSANQTEKKIAGNSVPSNRYSARLREGESAALVAKDQTSAIRLNLARMLIDDESNAFDHFRWSKALQRPASSLRWHVGISMANPDEKCDPVKRAVARKVIVKRPGNKILEDKTGQIGMDSAIVLRKLVDDGLMGKVLKDHSFFINANNATALTGANRSRNNEIEESTDESLFDSKKQPELHYSGVEVSLGTGRSYHIQVARDRGSDILLLIDVDVRRIRNKIMNVTTLYVIDVRRGKELMRSAALNNLKIELERENALKDDAVYKAMKKLDRFCRENIALTTLPEILNRENVLNRLGKLKDKLQDNHLAHLAEAKFYVQNNLITLDDYKKFCQSVLGDDAGVALTIGSPQYRFDAIKKHLPNKYLVAQE